MVELGVQFAVGQVTAGGDVEVLDLDPGDHAGHAAGVALAAGLDLGRVLDRQARGDGHPVPALLPGDPQVRQAHLGKGLGRELAGLAFYLLHAQHVGRLFAHEAGGLFGAQADGVDVPGADTQAHGPSSGEAIGESCAQVAARRRRAKKGRSSSR